jgi:hypothetical protein
MVRYLRENPKNPFEFTIFNFDEILKLVKSYKENPNFNSDDELIVVRPGKTDGTAIIIKKDANGLLLLEIIKDNEDKMFLEKNNFHGELKRIFVDWGGFKFYKKINGNYQNSSKILGMVNDFYLDINNLSSNIGLAN